MAETKTEFSIEIPIQIEQLKLFFFISPKTTAIGTKSANFPHNHGKFYELRYVARGEYIQYVESESFLLRAGDIILIQPNEYHYQKDCECSDDLLQLSLRFFVKSPSDDCDPATRKAYDELVEILDKSRLVQDSNFEILPYIQKIMDEYEKKRYGYFVNLQAACMFITTEFLRLCKKKSSLVFPSKEMKHGFYWRDRLDYFLRSKYAEDVKLGDLADVIGLSQRQTSRVFLREFGMSFVDKLIQIRLEQAKFKLANSELSAIEICYACGFKNYNYFCLRFKKSAGMTPLKYREKLACKKDK